MKELFKFYQKHRNAILFLMDIVLVIIAIQGALIMKYGNELNYLFSYNKFLPIYLIVVIIIYGTSFLVTRIYKSLWSYINIEEISLIFVAVFAAFVINYLIDILIFKIKIIEFLIISAFILVVFMILERIMYRFIRKLYYYLKNMNIYQRQALIIGAGDAGYLLLQELKQNNRFNAKVVGFLDDNRIGRKIDGYKVLAPISDIKYIVKKYNIDLVFLAIPSLTNPQQNQILKQIYDLTVEIKIMKSGENFFENNEKDYRINDISIEDLLGRRETNLSQSEIKSYISGEVILVTGAGGTIGSQIAREVYHYFPKTLILLDVNENGIYMLEQEFMQMARTSTRYSNINVVSLVASVRDEAAINNILSKYRVDVVYHAAAHKHVPLMETRPQEAVKNNVIGTRNMIDLSIKHRIKRFIMISTDKAVNPTNAMGASKRLTEMILQSRKHNGFTKLAAVRFGNVLGSNGSVIPIFTEQIKKGGPVTITDKKIVRYFMSIKEAAQLVLQAGFYADKGEIFILDMKEPVKILDLAENLIKLAGYRPYKDINIIEIGLRPGEKMFEELKLTNESVTKTKNNLIFKNQSFNIDPQKLDAVINDLYELAKKNLDIEVEKQLLEIIHRREFNETE